MSWGNVAATVARQRVGIARRWGSRPWVDTLGSATSARLGVHEGDEGDYRPRAVDDALEDRLGCDAPLVVVTGEPGAGASRSTVRAARRTLGDSRVVGADDPGDADVARLVATARRRGATLVWLDGASLRVLDQITPALVDDATRGGVRLVVTTAAPLIGADHPEDGTADLLRAAVVAEVGPLAADEAGPGEVGRLAGAAGLGAREAVAFVDPVGRRTLVPQALARVAATWDVLGVPVALTPARLAALTPAALVELGAPPASEWAIRGAIRRCTRGRVHGVRVLSASRRRAEVHLRPHPLLRAVRSTHVRLRQELQRVLDDPDQRLLVARAALAVGEDAVAAELVASDPVRGLGPLSALRVAVATPGATRAGPWYRLALETTDDDAVRRTASVGVGLAYAALTGTATERARSLAEAKRYMEAAVPDQRALLWLGEYEHAPEDGGSEAARALWVQAAAGPDRALAAQAAALVADVDVDAGRDREALPFLHQALAEERGTLVLRTPAQLTLDPPPPTRLTLARVQRRLGDLDDAERTLHTLLDHGVLRQDDARTELGLVAEARGDEACARHWYREALFSDEAQLRLAELDLRAGDWAAVRDRMQRARDAVDWWDDAAVHRWQPLRFRDAGHRAWGSWLAGEAAYQLGDLHGAERWFGLATGAPGDREGRAQVRLGQIAVARGDVVDGYHRLAALAESDGPVAEEAAPLATAVADEARRRIEEERHRPPERAYVAVLRDGSHRIVHGP